MDSPDNVNVNVNVNINSGIAYHQERLWRKQLEVYPKSVQLTPQEVIQWAAGDGEYIPEWRSGRRFRAIAFSIQYPVNVWYRIPGMGEVTGCRVGLENSEYLSGFSDL